MRRPKLSRPPALLDLQPVYGTDLYARTSDGITYRMPLELTRGLKRFYAHFRMSLEEGGGKYPTMERWFETLTLEDKKQVERIGMPPEQPEAYHDGDHLDCNTETKALSSREQNPGVSFEAGEEYEITFGREGIDLITSYFPAEKLDDCNGE